MSQTDRDILFSNEAFVTGMLQVVSGGALIAALAQSEEIIKLAGSNAFLLLITVMSAALLTAVFAAYFKHQYKLWDVKAQSSAARKSIEESQSRSSKSAKYLKWMRRALFLSLISFSSGICILVVSVWLHA